MCGSRKHFHLWKTINYEIKIHIIIMEMKQKYIKTYIDVWIQENISTCGRQKTMKLNSHYYDKGDETKIH